MKDMEVRSIGKAVPIYSNIYGHLERLIQEANDSLFIATPFFTMQMVDQVLKLIDGKAIRCEFLTRPEDASYAKGLCSYKALKKLQDHGFEIKQLRYLHAKMYVADQTYAIIGSANLTSRGTGFDQMGNDGASSFANKEAVTKLRLSKDDYDTLYNTFWEEAVEFVYSEKMDKEIEDCIEEYHSPDENISERLRKIREKIITPYERLLIEVKKRDYIDEFNKIQKGSGRNVFAVIKDNIERTVKIHRSDPRTGNEAYENYYGFTIRPKTVDTIMRQRINAVVLLLEEPAKYIWLPRRFMENHVFLKTHIKKDGEWQFQVYQEDGKTILQSKGKNSKRQFYDVSAFMTEPKYSYTKAMEKNVKVKVK